MNEIVNKYLAAGDKFMPEIHLEQAGFTYSTCSSFTKTKTELKKLCREEIQIAFKKMILKKLIFNII